MRHVLSFDIEDWFHIVDIPGLDDSSTWGDRVSIVEEKTDFILALLNEFDTKATFFMLGWIAERYPSLARRISEAGHEVASHSYWHRRVYDLSPEEFHADLKRSVDVLEDQTGVKVKGFRAPSFSITPGSEWAFDVIRSLGLEYDASLFPAKRGHGGYMCQQEAHVRSTALGELPELPMSVAGVGPLRVPFSGGGYLRVLPLWAINQGFRAFERKGVPVVVYLHPRDFAPEQPVVRMPPARKFKSYVGLSTTEGKVRFLLENYQFTTCYDAVMNEPLKAAV